MRDVAEPPSMGAADAVLEFDAWLDRQARDRLVVLAVDDVQWADQSSLDVLMYVIAGRPERRLAVLVSLRTGDEHRLHRWLADVRRLPRVHELRLGRLDRVSTGEQIGALLGRPPHESLVDEVHDRSGGNPYLTSLLVRGLPTDARSLPPHLPTELRDALARSWHGLSAGARALTSRIAVAGRPQPASGAGLPLLREAVDAGVLRVQGDERYWFVHPLLAEVLVETLLPDERRALHAELAESTGDPIDRADHYHRAGMPGPAYRWALRAADAAEATGGAAEAVELLRRAYRLRPAGAHASPVELQHRIRRAARRSGRAADELSAIEKLLGREADPLARAELLARRTFLRFALGIEFAGVADAREAERLSAGRPDSREHALATAELARDLLWHEDASGVAKAGEALRLARAGGWPDATGYALVASSMAHLTTGDLASAAGAAREAQEIGVRTRDPDLALSAAYWVSNTVDAPSLPVLAGEVRRCREDLERIGAPHSQVSELCSVEADILLWAGDWRACRERLWVALGARPSIRADVRARHTAALLASRQGRHAEAAAHATRAEELIMENGEFWLFPFDAVRAELAVAAGDAERAIGCARHGLELDPQPQACEVLLPLAARAIADLAQARRDNGEEPASELARMRELRAKYPAIVADGPGTTRHERLWFRAMRELTGAETARCRRDHDEAGRWHATADACAEAGTPWEETYCRWREAQSALRERSARRPGVAALRQAYGMAIDLEADPLIGSLELLARNARVILVAVDAAPPPAGAIPGLTRREREILAHVVAGRTYGEIARALVLSEKTVSAHISNMLRKTGTTGRVELAELAHRRTWAGEPEN
ncbi:LuxR C-terminal-related transcriptional regulator [Actinoplanes sp. CA-142083]|uniref:LuxR C-terminal-related transcriptional regulator n=1 Tax=Actinoplanes sp. CA-142083 TaxID=3239903 RepID=UPI003D9173E1